MSLGCGMRDAGWDAVADAKCQDRYLGIRCGLAAVSTDVGCPTLDYQKGGIWDFT